MRETFDIDGRVCIGEFRKWGQTARIIHEERGLSTFTTFAALTRVDADRMLHNGIPSIFD